MAAWTDFTRCGGCWIRGEAAGTERADRAAGGKVRWRNTFRLIPSRYPSTGILERVASPQDLPYVFDLESWTNDRISALLGVLHRLSEGEWATGPQAAVVMAAYCHPRQNGRTVQQRQSRSLVRRPQTRSRASRDRLSSDQELAEVGVFETRVQMRLYLADFNALFHDVRDIRAAHDPASYEASQTLAHSLLRGGSNGVVFRSVRYPGGECIACFRPKLVGSVRPGAHFGKAPERPPWFRCHSPHRNWCCAS